MFHIVAVSDANFLPHILFTHLVRGIVEKHEGVSLEIGLIDGAFVGRAAFPRLSLRIIVGEDWAVIRIPFVRH